jgi:signal transduction histidine kinase
VRLAAERLSSELVPPARAVNQALDRLEAGMDQQRRFTANAAHQLRTPLAILKAGLDVLDGNGKIQALREVAHMNRLVDQLLRVARLDNVTFGTLQMIDLKAIATQQISTSQRWPCRRTAKFHSRALMCLSLPEAMRMPLGMSCAISLKMTCS